MTFKSAHVAAAMILTSVRWSVAHPVRDGSIDVYGHGSWMSDVGTLMVTTGAHGS